MTTSTILQAALDRISDPDRWVQHESAIDCEGNPVGAHDPSAVAWCALGALEAVTRGNPHGFHDAREELSEAMYMEEVTTFNDENDHADVLSAFYRAIKNCDEQG